MKNEDHRLAAEDDEATIPVLTASAIGDRGNRMIIEGYFGSAFHWIAYKCDLAYGKH